jgi:hypothetical protein
MFKKVNTVAPGTVGNPTGAQVDPFHSSAEAVSVPTMPPPTAMHQVDVTHDTLPVGLVEVGAVIVFGMVDQLEALTCAGAVRPCGVVAPPPADSRSVIGSASNATAHPAVKRRIANRIGTSRIASGWRSGRTPRHPLNVQEGSCIGVALP